MDGLARQDSEGRTSIPWDTLKSNTMEVQKDNLYTLVELWSSIADYTEKETRWGDEIEYVLLQLNHEDQSVKVTPRGCDVIRELHKDKSDTAIDIQREAYEYMVETSPLKPYTSDLETLATVEQNMRDRYACILSRIRATTNLYLEGLLFKDS